MLRPAVLVLAGGEGKRMGGGKPQRQLAGRTLLDFALDRARQSGAPIAIGARFTGQLAMPNDVVCVPDDAAIDGPLASLSAGLTWAAAVRAQHLLTLPCDAPFLPDDLGQKLQRRADGKRPVLPMSRGQVHPACGLWPVCMGAQLPAYLATGRRSLLGFADHVGYQTEDWGSPERDPFFNVNTPEDLRTAGQWLVQPHLE